MEKKVVVKTSTFEVYTEGNNIVVDMNEPAYGQKEIFRMLDAYRTALIEVLRKQGMVRPRLALTAECEYIPPGGGKK